MITYNNLPFWFFYTLSQTKLLKNPTATQTYIPHFPRGLDSSCPVQARRETKQQISEW